MKYTFDFSVSCSGDCRAQAKELAKLLVDKGTIVFYDEFYLAHLLGKRLDNEFSWVFGAGTRFFVPFVSTAYARKPWPQYELGVARREAEKRQGEFILPLRVDDTLLPGLPETVCYLDLRHMGLREVADFLFQKLASSTAESACLSQPQDWVATFGLSMDDLEGAVLSSEAPSDYATLCDWLTEELMNRLTHTPLENIRDIRVVEDLRSGETLSVRVRFVWNPSKGALHFGDMGWWELLELLPYDELYETDDNR